MNRNRKLSRVGKTIVSGLVVTSLVLGNGSMIQAEKVTKEESVYVNADADGEAEKITVSDWLKNAGINGTLKDKSELKDITNVKGDETFEQSGDGVSWNAGAQDIYYQGTTDKELPVGVKLVYELDGKEISPEELPGKSGALKIRVSYTNRSRVTKTIDGKNQKMYTPFFMATGLILPTDKFTNVEVDGGKVINEGTNNIVVGFGVPGMADSLDVSGELAEKFQEEFTVSADVTDFSIGNTFTYASASLLSDLDLEDSDTFEELEEKLETLTDATEELVDGSDSLADGIEELGEKFDAFAKGEKDLNKGINTLAKSGKKLEKGVKEYVTGVDDLAGGATSYVNGAKQITDGNKQLYQAVKDMPGSYREFSEGIKQYTTAVDTLGEKKTGDALKAGAASVASGISSLHTNLSALESTYDNYDQLVKGIQAQAEQCGDEVQKQTLLAYAEKLKELSEGQKSSVSALAKATSGESDLKKGADQISGGVKKMVEGAQAISNKSASLREADEKMTSSVSALTANIEKLKNGSEKLSQNDRKLLAGAKKLLKAGKSVRRGSRQLISGAGELKKGSGKLDKATGQVSDGIGRLGDGSQELLDGMKKFDREGIQEINRIYEEDFEGLKDRLSALLDISEEYTNFTGIGDGMDGEVKFIIETEEISNDEDE